MAEETESERAPAEPEKAPEAPAVEPPPELKMDRRSVLVGALGGVVTGGGAGFFAGGEGQKAKAHEEARLASASASAAASAKPPAPRGSAKRPPHAYPTLTPTAAALAHASFAQQGEDLVMQAMLLDVAQIVTPSYIDIGAFEPIFTNNTYLFYVMGGRGVLIEPNPAYTPKLRAERPEDIVLEIGIGISDAAEADYWTFKDANGQLNTFSKEQADKLTAQGATPDKMMKRQLVKINEILEKHFKDRAPDIFSIDVEGLDLEIMKTMNFDRWRPYIICTETSELGTGRLEQETIDFLAKKGYQVRGGSYVNTIFLDTKPRPKKSP